MVVPHAIGCRVVWSLVVLAIQTFAIFVYLILLVFLFLEDHHIGYSAAVCRNQKQIWILASQLRLSDRTPIFLRIHLSVVVSGILHHLKQSIWEVYGQGGAGLWICLGV